VKLRKLIAIGLIVLGVACAMFAVFLLWSEHQMVPTAPTDSAQVAAPASKKPAAQAVASYTVAPDLPKYIAIPAIKLANTRVRQLGLKNNQIATPDNIYDAGWYNASAKPGQDGAMFIYGHVSSWQANGAFYNLKKLTAGDTITITRGDNATFTYKVVSSKIYPKDDVDMNAVLAPVDASKPGLNLMTCTGTVIKGTSEFSDRLVVFMSLVS
jgi:LPXTG-site transpeptidase (sortase) family protein